MNARLVSSLLLAAAMLIAGCSPGGDGKSGAPEAGAESAAAAVIVRLDGELRAGRYDDVCARLFSPSARREAGGGQCARRLRIATVGVTDPHVRLTSIDVHGATARARVRVTSGGRRATDQTIVLDRTGGSFRITGLSD